MMLESLANELLLDLFEYFSTIELFRAFYHLNSRFNDLLLFHFRAYHLDFRTMFKADFDSVLGHYLPLIHDRIYALRLSNGDDDSPLQTDLLHDYGLALSRFSQLRSLTLYLINSEKKIGQLISECHQLSHLTHLRIEKCDFAFQSIDAAPLFQSIWRLPNLINFCLDVRASVYFPTILVPSLQHLSLRRSHCRVHELNKLFQHAPHLQSLGLALDSVVDDSDLQTPVLSLAALTLYDVRSKSTMFRLLRKMPNLRRLTVETACHNLDGQQWETLINTSLSKLKVFRFLSRIQYRGAMNNEQQLDRLLHSYQSPFWLEERRWFIRCHRRKHRRHDSSDILLYTIPQTLKQFDFDRMSLVHRTTCPDEGKASALQRVDHLIWQPSNNLDFSDDFCICFSHIRHLSIDLPLDEKFWTVVENLHHLKSLAVGAKNDSDADIHLQALLDRSPSLDSLTIISWPLDRIPLISNTSRSLRKLDLGQLNMGEYDDTRSFFNIERLSFLARSSLGVQCEILRCCTVLDADVIDLIRQMTRLRTLHISEWSTSQARLSHNRDIEKEKALIEQLHRTLPSAWIHSQNSGAMDCIRLWIR